jgi:uncharacterized protein YbjT (DUF2867 family)
MKIVIPGGSGYVGTVLARALHKLQNEVVVLSRRQRKAPVAHSHLGRREHSVTGPRNLKRPTP